MAVETQDFDSHFFIANFGLRRTNLPLRGSEFHGIAVSEFPRQARSCR